MRQAHEEKCEVLPGLGTALFKKLESIFKGSMGISKGEIKAGKNGCLRTAF